MYKLKVSIELLSMRQLSFTLSNQAVLNRTKAHLIRRATSLPRIQREKEFNEDSQPSSPSPGNTAEVAAEVAAFDTKEEPSQPVPAYDMFSEFPPEKAYGPSESNSLISSTSLPLLAEAKNKIGDEEIAPNINKNKSMKRPKPMLSLQVSDADSSFHAGILPLQTGKGTSNKPTLSKYQNISIHNNHHNESGVLHTASSSGSIRLSPHGTLHVGKLKIMENGIFSSEDSLSSSSNSFTFNNGGKGSNGRTQSFSESGDKSESGDTSGHSNGSNQHPQTRPQKRRISDPISASFGGKSDFIEIGTLGSGAR